ncbi:MAG: endolytic transglycosylase MltG [Gammaproteobacteria bacterium]|nr:endolytic transglycosylase MltG [Gammaproteobacteria bacterium]MCF6363594.1 endolytic transglycosylase MltG [Gammaproteobacteria bacterium]
MTKSRFFKLFGGVILLASLTTAWVWMDYQSFTDETLDFGESGLRYELKSGMTLTRVAHDLQTRGIIDRPRYLVWLGQLEGKAKQIKAGEYRFDTGITPRRLLQQLVNGETLQYAITIVEGWNFRQLMDAVHSNEYLLHTLSDYSDAEIMQQLGYSGEHPEGRFLPDTYHFPRMTTDVVFLQRAYAAMQTLLGEEWPARSPDLAFDTSYKALILASIVEKETALPSERKQIAGVFNRRLKKRMRLQTDPTVIYGLGRSFDGNIRRRDLRRDTPYNTYLHKGLPPTPIAMPGRDAVIAALHPAEGGELYFVSRGDGSHQFSATLKEHNKAVVEYQLGGRAKPFSSLPSGKPDK